MGDKDKRSAFTTVVMSDIENNTQAVVYNSYTLPLLIYNGGDMSKNIEKIEAVPDKGITIQNDIVFYDSTYESANDTFEFVLITLNELEGTKTHSLAELIDDGFTITPFINGGGGSSDFSTAEVTINNTKDEGGITIHAPFIDDGVIYMEKLVFYEAPQTISVILFQGMSGEVFSSIDGPDGPENVDATSVTGGVEQVGDGFYSITGDGNITF